MTTIYFIPDPKVNVPFREGMEPIDVMRLHAEMTVNEILYRARRGEVAVVENLADGGFTVYDPRLPEHYQS